MHTTSRLLSAIRDIPTRPNLFNQYRDHLPIDLPEAPAMRLANLEKYLTSIPARPRALLLAEAPGPWGCRFTGIPITSEFELSLPDFPLKATRCTAGGPRKEYSAGIFWRAMISHFPNFIVWNSVPFHPFHPGSPDSIRTPSAAELKEFAWLTELVIRAFNPHGVFALGRRAEKQLKYLEYPSSYIRHPSQGGARLFEKGIGGIFGA